MIHIFRKIKDKAGFTLTELLVAIAIIVALSAVAFGIAPNYMKRLHQHELDQNAEILYSAVQNRLTELRVSGQSDAYDKDEHSEIHAFPDGYTFSNAGSLPYSIKNMAYFVANENRTTAEMLLPRDRVDESLWIGNWVVEYNYVSGTVWGVFYIEGDTPAYEPDSFNSLRSSFDDRMNLNVGYYGKGTADLNPGSETHTPSVVITNGEILQADFSCPIAEGDEADNFYFYYTIIELDDSGLETSKKYSSSIKAKTGSNADGETVFLATLKLDSLEEGNYQFNRFKVLTPGADMLLEFMVGDADGKEDGEPVHDTNNTFNSLFATGTTKVKDGLASIKFGRHLQNLDTDTSSVTNKITSAKMENDISFKSDSAWYKVYTSRTLTPITNENLNSFDGNSKTIKEMKAYASEKGAGLFGAFYGREIKDLTLEGPVVQDVKDNENGNTAHVGILAGQIVASADSNGKATNVSNITIESSVNAGSDLDPTAISHGGNAGGLIGMVNVGSKATSTATVVFSDISIDYPSIEAKEYKVGETVTSGAAGGIIGGVAKSDYLNINIGKVKLNTGNENLVTVKSAVGDAGGFIGTSSSKLQIQGVAGNKEKSPVSYNVCVTSTSGNAGGVVGSLYANGTFANIWLQGAQVMVSSAGGESAGGLVGTVSNAVTRDTTINTIYFNYPNTYTAEDDTLLVQTHGQYAGGLIGYLAGSPSIGSDQANELVLTDVGISAKLGAGGLIGCIESSTPAITNCKVQGDSAITGLDGGNAGGFIGVTTGDCSNNSTIIQNSRISSVISKDGNGNVTEVDSVIVSATGGSAGGLVGLCAGSFLTSTVTATDVEVYSESSEAYAGGFAGEINNGAIPVVNHYYFYCTTEKLTKKGISIAKTIKEKTPSDSFVFGQTASGGFVGCVTLGTPSINDSFASTTIGYYNNKQSDSSGGMVGSCFGNASICRSYADSYIFGSVTGGMVGTTNEDTSFSINACYSAGYLFGTVEQAGISCGTLKVDGNSYTICSPNGTATSNYSTVKGALTGTSGQNVFHLFDGTAPASVSYVNEHMVQYMWSSDTDTRNKFATLLGSSFTSGGSSTKYDINTWGYHPSNSYPYPKISTIDKGNIGDWEEYVFSGMQTQLVYFEQYSDGSYGVYGNTYDVYRNTITSTLQDSLVYGDGYGILSERWDVAGTVTLDLTNSSDTDWNFNSKMISVTVKVKSKDGTETSKKMILRILPSSYSENASSDNKVLYNGNLKYSDCYPFNGDSAGTSLVYFNPRSAKCITVDGIVSKFIIRSPRQLWALSKTYYSYASDLNTLNNNQGADYEQELDLDYSIYKWSEYTSKTSESPYFIQEPIGYNGSSESVAFSRSYNGGYHEIKNVSFSKSGSSETQSGLFAIVGGSNTIQNVFLVNEYRDSKNSMPGCDSDAQYIGVLAGKVNSGATVTNCAVCCYEILATANKQSRYIGGLIGQNSGTIHNCSVSIRGIRMSGSSNNSYDIGGFVGNNNGIIYDCYSIGLISHIGNSRTGGFVGNNNNTPNNITNCYCMTASENGIWYSDGVWYGFSYLHPNSRNGCYWLVSGKSVLDLHTLSLYGGNNYFHQQWKGNWNSTGAIMDLSEMISKLPKTGTCSPSKYYNYNESGDYPYKHVVTDASGNYIHYGDWARKASNSVSLTGINLTSSTDSLQMEEGETKTLYITAADADTNKPITSEISLSLSSTNGNIEIDNTPLDGDVVDETTGKTIDEMTDLDTGEYPGALAFTCTALSTGPDSIQVDQGEVIDDFLNIEDPTAEEESNSNQSDTTEGSVSESGLDVLTTEGVNSNQNEISEDSLTESDVEHQTSDNQEPSLLTQESISSESEIPRNTDTIYILTEPLTLTANVYKSGHVGIVSIEKETFDSQVLSSNDVVLPARETAGTYQKNETSTGEFEVMFPYSEEWEDENYNQLLYLARDASLETNSAQIIIKNISVTRHVISATELFDETYELYNLDDSEVNSWNYENYFFKTGDTFSGQNEDYMYTYLPITFTGRYADPVSISIVVSNGTETYCLSYDMDSVQNEFLISCIDGQFIKPIFEKMIAYGEPFNLPVQEDIDAFVASLNDEELQVYTENRRGYIYQTAVKDENGLEESIWSPKWAMIVYENQTYELERTPISYTLSFNPNGGTGQMDSISAVYDELIELPKCTFTKEGADFKGWALSADGEVKFQEDSYVYSLTDEDQGEAVLYAIWYETAEPALDEEEKKTEESGENSTAENKQSEQSERTDTSSTSETAEESERTAKDGDSDKNLQTNPSETVASEDTQKSGDVSTEQNSSATDSSNTETAVSETPTESEKGSDSNDSTETIPNEDTSAERSSNKPDEDSSGSDKEVANSNSSSADMVNSGAQQVTDKTIAPEPTNGDDVSAEEKKTPDTE